LVTHYENLECLSITAFGGKHECRFSALARDVPPFPTCWHRALLAPKLHEAYNSLVFLPTCNVPVNLTLTEWHSAGRAFWKSSRNR